MERPKTIETKDMPLLPQAKCQRCEHIWILRKPNPKKCPKCKSPYWNKPRKKLSTKTHNVKRRKPKP